MSSILIIRMVVSFDKKDISGSLQQRGYEVSDEYSDVK